MQGNALEMSLRRLLHAAFAKSLSAVARTSALKIQVRSSIWSAQFLVPVKRLWMQEPLNGRFNVVCNCLANYKVVIYKRLTEVCKFVNLWGSITRYWMRAQLKNDQKSHWSLPEFFFSTGLNTIGLTSSWISDTHNECVNCSKDICVSIPTVRT